MLCTDHEIFHGIRVAHAPIALRIELCRCLYLVYYAMHVVMNDKIPLHPYLILKEALASPTPDQNRIGRGD